MNVIDENIHVAFSVHDLSDIYNRINSTAIASLLSNSTSHIVVHILTDIHLNENKPEYVRNCERYAELCKRYDAELYFHHVTVPTIYYNYPTTQYLTIGTYYRLFVAEVLSDINKVLYFDGDVIVNLDVVELWSLNLESKPIAARPDPIFQDVLRKHRKKTISQYHSYGFSDTKIMSYFNSGVIIMDLERIRSEMVLSQLADTFIQNNPSVLLADQDALNSIFGDNYYMLTSRFNSFSCEDPLDANESCILHYCNYKPWQIIRGNGDYLYWKYAIQTRWFTDNPDEALHQILSVVNMTDEGLVNYSKYKFSEKLHNIHVIIGDAFAHIFRYISDKANHKY